MNKSSSPEQSIHFRRFTVAVILFGVLSAAIPILISELIGGWTKKYTSRVNYSAHVDMSGKVAIVTGANTGIGLVTARRLAEAGAHVIVAARSITKGEAAVSTIRSGLMKGVGSAEFLQLDLASLVSVRKFAAAFMKKKLPVHVLVNNAGVMKSPGALFIGKNLTYGFDVTEEGFEYHIGVNHIGHFYLTNLLLDVLKSSTPSRVVTVSSSAESGASGEGINFDRWLPKGGVMPESYEDGVAYGQSKLANLMFAAELAGRVSGSGVSAYACHPGVIETELMRYMEPAMQEEVKKDGLVSEYASKLIGPIFSASFSSSEDGALNQFYLATADSKDLVNGANYHPIGRLTKASHPQASNATLQALLWDNTLKILKKKGFKI